MDKKLLGTGALLGFLAVALGAFGAHVLKTRISPELLAVLEVGVRYQMFHALAILVLAGLSIPSRKLNQMGWFFVGGTVLFSGSLYLVVFTGVKVFGAITPLGGLLFLIAWGLLVKRLWLQKSGRTPN